VFEFPYGSQFDWLKITRVKMAAITNQTMLKLAIFTISLILCCAGDNADQIKIEEFNVKPGGVQHSFAVDLVRGIFQKDV
jgi:hypothetical protein